jgi:hypothetical protein
MLLDTFPSLTCATAHLPWQLGNIVGEKESGLATSLRHIQLLRAD